MITLLYFILSLLIGFIGTFIITSIYGILFPASIAIKIFPKSTLKHFNKLYLHVLWLIYGVSFALLSLVLLQRIFDKKPDTWFFMLLFLPTFLIFFKKGMTSPLNLGYYNYRTDITEIQRVNKIEAVSKMVSFFLGAIIFKILFTS